MFKVFSTGQNGSFNYRIVSWIDAIITIRKFEIKNKRSLLLKDCVLVKISAKKKVIFSSLLRI